MEKKRAGSAEWEPATADGRPVLGTSARIEGLEENADYEFRVRAVNAAGPGDPSFPSEMIKVAKKKGECLRLSHSAGRTPGHFYTNRQIY